MLDPLLDEDYCNQANGNRQRQHGEKKYVQQSKTVTMAEDLKYKSSLHKN
jgi:hypothetical protein